MLIPTRNRAELIPVLLHNILDTVSNPHAIEIVFGVDDDDTHTQHTISTITPSLPIKIQTIVSPRPARGYQDIHLLYNELASYSNGKYLWIFNDDVTIKSLQWDVVLHTVPDHKKIVQCDVFGDGRQVDANMFPILHSDIQRVLGFIGIHSSIDVQYELISEKLPHIWHRETSISVHHDGHPVSSTLNAPIFNPAAIRFMTSEIDAICHTISTTFPQYNEH